MFMSNFRNQLFPFVKYFSQMNRLAIESDWIQQTQRTRFLYMLFLFSQKHSFIVYLKVVLDKNGVERVLLFKNKCWRRVCYVQLCNINYICRSRIIVLVFHRSI